MTNLSLIAAAAMALTLPVSVMAQERSEQDPQQQQQQAQARQGAQLSADAHHVIDKKAVNAQGKEIGTVKDALIGQDGRVQALIVDVDGKNRALPWNQISMKGDQLTVNMNDQQLSQLPEYRGEGE